MITYDMDYFYLRLSRVSISDIRTLFARLEELHDGRIDEARDWLISRGWEEIHEIPADALRAPDGRTYLQDGREVLRAQGLLWALTPAEISRRTAIDMGQSQGQAKAAPEQANSDDVCLSVIDDQLCGGSLTRAPVCPRCTLGKQGATATLTCDVYGHVTVVMGRGR